ncbi:MAG: undecaprenyl/decaprenyl-phosphate alpha-N-acetylglucosaminyl 1-phosphate transferase [Nitrospirae bacterium]|nr:undecaprenyl/decaprenyl-phosphate alpha-N-acetylglucosaminyl 1-phosphate transferase [Nitrospirota bacterium]
MSIILIYILTFLLALIFSLYGTPVAREAAIKFNIVDRPDGRLKNQAEPIPYLGGLAIYISFLLSLAITFNFSNEVLGLLLSGTIIVLLGLIDDFGVLSPKVKFLGQIIAAFVLIKSGIKIDIIFFPEWFDVLLTFLWIIGITNAFNIVDVMDGLSAGIAAIATFILFIVALINSNPLIAVFTIALTGSLIGFLKYNFYPARIYMGDTGSMFIGFMIGALAMIGKYTLFNKIGFLVPLVILGIPVFDTLFVMYIRFRRGLSIFRGSNDHFALRLRRWRLSVRQTVLLSYLIGAVLGLFALFIIYLSDINAMLSLSILTVLILIAGFYLKKIDMTM